MPLEQHSSDSSCGDLDPSRGTVHPQDNDAVSSQRPSDFSDLIRTHPVDRPTRPKSGNSFSIKYLLGLDKTSAATNLEYEADIDATRTGTEPTETTTNSA